MSFAITVVDPSQHLYAATDSKITNLIDDAPLGDVQKLFPLGAQASISLTGYYDLALSIIALFSTCYEDTWTLDETLAELSRIAVTFEAEYYKRIQRLADCTFLFARNHNGVPEQAVLMISGRKIVIVKEPLRVGDYHFFFSHPVDMKYEMCKQLCNLYFQTAGSLPTPDVLQLLIRDIAQQSKYVNDNVQLWNPAQN